MYGDDLISKLVGGSGGGHAIRGSGNAGGGGGAISFIVTGSFTLEVNSTISANGGAGSSHYAVPVLAVQAVLFGLRQHL